MKTFNLWLVEMANLVPNRKGDTLERTQSTHMRYPVWAPSIFYVIISRDHEKYPDGMTASEIAEELIEKSEKRDELKGDEIPAPDNWKELVRASWPEFVRGISSMLNHSPLFMKVGTRKREGGRGKDPAIFHPTREAFTRQGGSKFSKGVERDLANIEAKLVKQKKAEERAAKITTRPGVEIRGSSEPLPEPTDQPAPPVSEPSDTEGGEDEIRDMLKDMFK